MRMPRNVIFKYSFLFSPVSFLHKSSDSSKELYTERVQIN